MLCVQVGSPLGPWGVLGGAVVWLCGCCVCMLCGVCVAWVLMRGVCIVDVLGA